MRTRMTLLMAIQCWVLATMAGGAAIMLFAMGEYGQAGVPALMAVGGMLLGGVFLRMYRKHREQLQEEILAELKEAEGARLIAEDPQHYDIHPLFSEEAEIERKRAEHGVYS